MLHWWSKDMLKKKLDVKTAFLHGNLEEEIYMLQPEGFEEKEKKNLVCRLNKSLYGLKRAPRCWYKRFDSFIMCLGYNRLNADPCAYFKRSSDNDFVILLLYVDDMLVAGPNKDHIEELKAQVTCMSPSSEEEMIEMSRVPYASAVGSLMFAMICTRPDIAQAVGVVNSDYAGDLDKSKSTTGYVFKVAGGAVSWVSKLQSVVATSTTEAEYVAATQASKEAIWLKMLLEELGHNQEYVSMFCNSQSALHLARNPSFYSRTKHIRVQYHFIHEKVEERTVDMQKIHTKDNIVDFTTNAINADKFTWCRSSCGLSETCDFALSDSRLPQHFVPLLFIETIAPLCGDQFQTLGMTLKITLRGPLAMAILSSPWTMFGSHPLLRLTGILNGHDPFCSVCHSHQEPTLHVLRDCSVAKEVWSLMDPSLISADFYQTNPQDCIMANHNSNLIGTQWQLPWHCLFVSTLWQLWKNSNDKVFNNTSHLACVVHCRSIIWTRYYVESKSQSTLSATSVHVLEHWKAPNPGWISLNVDGAVSIHTGSGVVGGVFRDHEGAWVLGFNKTIGITQPLQAELWAIFIGIQIVWDHGFDS
ncbi:hypothetical protein F3Y22_tig00110777pilonHSYRG00051 [Hibiscus syriacus]|uniref:Reverse transcriptase Ty1/copia-type domain-containing protein n=1 Tax=Hibiscus syriacus TaxID=106335 RepID=A0A6A2ZTI0_HIBSY|nr:hypothetical protein F3Y22_tig00110777pilonHSYRG00051 [Hibiscus syriacus]